MSPRLQILVAGGVVIAILTVGVIAAATSPSASSSPNMVEGKEPANVPPGRAYLDGQEIYFIHTEVSDADVAKVLSRALRDVRMHLPSGVKLFLNTSVRALADPVVAGSEFMRAVDAQGLRRADVVLEITERGPLEEQPAHREALRALKRRGFCLAVDDMGAGYSSLQSLVDLEPDDLKFAVSLVHHIDRSPIQRSLLETLVNLSTRIGAKVIAEGIETEAELTTLREMGVLLGQGRYLAPPAPVPREMP